MVDAPPCGPRPPPPLTWVLVGVGHGVGLPVGRVHDLGGVRRGGRHEVPVRGLSEDLLRGEGTARDTISPLPVAMETKLRVVDVPAHVIQVKVSETTALSSTCPRL